MAELTGLEAEAAEVEGGLAEVCGLLNAAHGRLVGLVARALVSGCWAGPGLLSCEQWVAWQTGLSPARARQIVRMARRQSELPVTFAAMVAGELSVDQAAVVARHTPADCEVDVVEFARAATVSQLRRTLRSYQFEPEPVEVMVERPDPCFVSGVFDEEGRYRLRAVLDPDDGAVVDAALREAHDALFHAGDGKVTWGDALVEVATRSLGAVTSPARREVFTALFHVDTDQAGGYLHQGPVLPDAIRRQLLCDGRGAVVGVRHGRPVDVGRSRRIVPTPLRRLVEDHDRGCRVPGCTNARVQIHHVVHWEDGGRTDRLNLVALCHRHHRLHHQGHLGIEGDADRPDGLTFTDRRGRPLAGTPPPTPPNPAQRIDITGHWHHPTGERLHIHWIHFNTQPHTPAQPRAG